MDNATIESSLELLSKLMELHGENSFKARSYATAAYNISKLDAQIEKMSAEEMSALPLGVTVRAKITSLLQTGHIKALDELLEKTPEGVLEIMRVKGLGPKKVATIWKELGIESIDELQYACNENRLILLKGFGEKTQKSVLENLKFYLAHKNKFRYGEVEQEMLQVEKLLKEKFSSAHISLTGEMRRRCEVLDKVDFLLTTQTKQIEEELQKIGFAETNIENETVQAKSPAGVVYQFITCAEENFAKTLFETTGSSEHIQQVDGRIKDYDKKSFTKEEDIYQSAQLDFIDPELREGLKEIDWAATHQLPELLHWKDIRGVVHAHSKWSDGINTIEEMAKYSQKMGYEYLCISDHSQTAVYANGLKPDRIFQQHEEIDKLNKQFAPFKIFKGIESDILFDGSLDYEKDVLETFDFVIASIHSVFNMSEEKATERLMTAIKNPYTTILGHPTGRLLLSRKGYPVNHKAIIDCAAENGVIIELNAHPWRLDLDWRWIQYAIEKGVKISINPDAHNLTGVHDIYYGTLAARKGGLTKAMTFNSMNSEEIAQYFSERRKKRG